MKRISALLIALAFLLAIPALALGEGTAHTIEEYAITLVLPEGYRLITPDIDPDDPLLDIYGLTAEDVQDMFELMPLYMDAVMEDGSGEITVTIQDSTLQDYAELDSSMLELLMAETAAQSSQMGITITSSEICEYAGMPFTRSYFESALLEDCGVQYYTVWGGHSYSFALHSYSDILPDAKDEAMKRMMESVSFSNYVPKAEEVLESFVYTDKDNGVSFTVPEGWRETDDYRKTHGVHTAAFVPGKESSLFTMVYASEDMWDSLSPIEKLFKGRRGINNSYYSQSDVAESFGVSINDVEKVTLNGESYYRIACVQKIPYGSSTYDLDTLSLMRIHNARMYLYTFTGSLITADADDFEEMVAGASYPEAKSGPAPIVYVLIAAALIAALIIVSVTVSRKKRDKQREEEEARERARRLEELKAQEGAAAEKPLAVQMKHTTCPNCAATVEGEATFCAVCGRRLPNDEE